MGKLFLSTLFLRSFCAFCRGSAGSGSSACGSSGTFGSGSSSSGFFKNLRRARYFYHGNRGVLGIHELELIHLHVADLHRVMEIE